ncbi:MAG: HAD-IA family hydrolase [Muribaculaceae bacterium]|nr:HAD-IA family hydrolase [Muribaculaceae bacterium]
MYKTIIFDLDGTLLDSTVGIIDAVKITLEEIGLEIPSYEVLKTFIGPPIQDSLARQFALDKETAMKYADMFRANYRQYSMFRANLYPKVIELLRSLKDDGKKIAVATYKSHDNAMAVLEHFGILDFCDYALGSDPDGKMTKADIINECITKLGADKKFCVMVGDSNADAYGAAGAGIDFIALTHGFGFSSQKDLDNVKHVAACANISELAQVLLKDNVLLF